MTNQTEFAETSSADESARSETREMLWGLIFDALDDLENAAEAAETGSIAGEIAHHKGGDDQQIAHAVFMALEATIGEDEAQAAADWVAQTLEENQGL